MSGRITRNMGQLPYFRAGSQPEQRSVWTRLPQTPIINLW
jgi:hypothetical protein